jgi:hypothetical protein
VNIYSFGGDLVKYLVPITTGGTCSQYGEFCKTGTSATGSNTPTSYIRNDIEHEGLSESRESTFCGVSILRTSSTASACVSLLKPYIGKYRFMSFSCEWKQVQIRVTSGSLTFCTTRYSSQYLTHVSLYPSTSYKYSYHFSESKIDRIYHVFGRPEQSSLQWSNSKSFLSSSEA